MAKEKKSACELADMIAARMIIGRGLVSVYKDASYGWAVNVYQQLGAKRAASVTSGDWRCPRRSLRLNLTVDRALRWCSSATLSLIMIGMRPRAYQTLARRAQSLKQTRDRILIAIGPTADAPRLLC
jgi:hypothetical protein